MKALFDQSSYQCSKLVTKAYSTSFSLAIKLLSKSVQPQIYAIYGFVRYADEIVDSFHDYKQEELLVEFEEDYKKAVERKVSLNPILNSFQGVVNTYQLHDLVSAFMESMKMDLWKTNYNSDEEYEKYIYGSAQVVGLMCLKVFLNGDEDYYNRVKDNARSLGSAFQKVNFLRDIKADSIELGRAYFPNLQEFKLCDSTKEEIIKDIDNDFKHAYKGICQLPVEGKFGVYLAYKYYSVLLSKLKKRNSKEILETRIRVSDPYKMLVLIKAYICYKCNLVSR